MRLAYGLLGFVTLLTFSGIVSEQTPYAVKLTLLKCCILPFVNQCPVLALAFCGGMVSVMDGFLLYCCSTKLMLYTTVGFTYHCWFLNKQLYHNEFTGRKKGSKLKSMTFHAEKEKSFDAGQLRYALFWTVLLSLIDSATGLNGSVVVNILTNLYDMYSLLSSKFTIVIVLLTVSYLTRQGRYLREYYEQLIFLVLQGFDIYDANLGFWSAIMALIYLGWFFVDERKKRFFVMMSFGVALISPADMHLWWFRVMSADAIIKLLPPPPMADITEYGLLIRLGEPDYTMLAICMGAFMRFHPTHIIMGCIIDFANGFVVRGPVFDTLGLIKHPKLFMIYMKAMFSGRRIVDFCVLEHDEDPTSDRYGTARFGFWRMAILLRTSTVPMRLRGSECNARSYRHIDGRWLSIINTGWREMEMNPMDLLRVGPMRWFATLVNDLQIYVKLLNNFTPMLMKMCLMHISWLMFLNDYQALLLGIWIYFLLHALQSYTNNVFNPFVFPLFRRFSGCYNYFFNGMIIRGFSYNGLYNITACCFLFFLWALALIPRLFGVGLCFTVLFWIAIGGVGATYVEYKLIFRENAHRLFEQMKLNDSEVQQFYQMSQVVCDWKCQLLAEISAWEIVLYSALFLVVFYYYLWFVYRVTRKPVIVINIIVGIIVLQCYGINVGLLSIMCGTAFNAFLCVWLDSMMVVDVVLLNAIYLPVSGCVMAASYVWKNYGIIDVMAFDFTLVRIVLIAFLSGVFMGIVAFIECKSAAWTKCKVIIVKDRGTGRLLARYEKFGWLGSIFFGLVGGEMAGAIACAQTKLDHGWTCQTDVVKRYANSATSDGMPTRAFVKQLMINAQRLGRLDEFLTALNDEKPVDESFVHRMKGTMDPKALGVIKVRVDGVLQPVANGFVTFVNGMKVVVCNAHSVCVPDNAKKVFIDMQEDAFQAMDEIYFHNGHEEVKINVFTWSAQSDMCVNTLTRDLNVIPFTTGPIYVGKPYTWMGVAPPLDDPKVHFVQPIMPMPFGLVNSKYNQLGDSGSVLIDDKCRIVAMKYGIRTEGGALTDLAYFVPTHGLKYLNLVAPKIQATSLVDMKKAVEDQDYKEFVKVFLNTTDEIWKKFEEAAANKSKRDLDVLLKELSESQSNAKSVQKMLLGQLMYLKGRKHIEDEKQKKNPEYVKLIAEKDEITEKIKCLTLLIDQDDEDRKNDPIFLRCLELQARLAVLKQELDQKYPDDGKKKSLYKQLGQLGAKKSEVKQRLKELVEGADDTEISDLKSILKRINDAINKCAEKISDAKWNMNVVIEEDLLSSRMPLELQKIRYPYYYQDTDKKWHVWFSDTEEIVVDKHPCFSPDVVGRHEEFGFTKSGFRKKLQHCHVSKSWHDMIRKVEPSGLMQYIYKKLGGEECPYSIICQNCGHVILCDKKTHLGCSRYLYNQLDRHLQTCIMNMGRGKELLINGQLYTISGDKLCFGNVVCGETDDHKCFINALEFDALDKYKKKPHQYYHVKTPEVNLYVRKKCVLGFNVNKQPTEPAEMKKELSELHDRMEKMKEVFDVNLKNEQSAREAEMLKLMSMVKTFEDVTVRSFVDIRKDIEELAKTRTDVFKAVIDIDNKVNQRVVENEQAIKELDDLLSFTIVEENKNNASIDVIPMSEQPKPQRIRKRSRSPQKIQSSGDEGKMDREQLFFSNAAGQHDKLVGDCNCPRCVCEKGCKCSICTGQACIWCNEIGHSTKACKHARKRECNVCGTFIQNWYSKCIYDPSRNKFGTNVLCCTESEQCIICDTKGHCSMSCPVVRHSTFCKDARVVNYHGLNDEILDTMLLPPQDWVQVVDGKREMKRVKKERRERKKVDPQ
nr:MAG: hypothetical protein [Jingmen bat astrovirus 1]